MVRRAVAWLLRGYQLTLSAVLGRHCRFEPSCSEYARQAVLRHGVGKGLLLGLWRVARCGPFGGYGFDPVPDNWHLALPFMRSKPCNKGCPHHEA